MQPTPVPLDRVDLADLDVFERDEAWGMFDTLRREAPVHWNPEHDGGSGFWSITRLRRHRARSTRTPRPSPRPSSPTSRSPPEEYQELRRSILETDGPRHLALRKLLMRDFTPALLRRYEDFLRGLAQVTVARRCSRRRSTSSTRSPPTSRSRCSPGCSTPRRSDTAADRLGQRDRRHHRPGVRPGAGRLRGGREVPAPAVPLAGVPGGLRVRPQARRRAPRAATARTWSASWSTGSPRTASRSRPRLRQLLPAARRRRQRDHPAGDQPLDEGADRQPGPAAVAASNTPTRSRSRSRSSSGGPRRSTTSGVRRPATSSCTASRSRPGDKVVMWFASGNRDETKFEDPYALRLDRMPNDHITFGKGAHACMGSNLARMEMRIMFETLLPALAEIEPDRRHHAGSAATSSTASRSSRSASSRIVKNRPDERDPHDRSASTRATSSCVVPRRSPTTSSRCAWPTGPAQACRPGPRARTSTWSCGRPDPSVLPVRRPGRRHVDTVAVLLEPDGRGGSARPRHAGRGRRVTVRGPRNHFPLVAAPALPVRRRRHRHHAAAGDDLRGRAAGADWDLSYGGRTRASMAFLERARARTATG